MPRRGGWRDWGERRGGFEEALGAQKDPALVAAEIKSEARRGRDYVRVNVSAVVDAADIADAVAVAWDAFRQAAGDDAAGWDMAAASAEIRPEGLGLVTELAAPSAEALARWQELNDPARRR